MGNCYQQPYQRITLRPGGPSGPISMVPASGRPQSAVSEIPTWDHRPGGTRGVPTRTIGKVRHSTQAVGDMIGTNRSFPHARASVLWRDLIFLYEQGTTEKIILIEAIALYGVDASRQL